MQTKGKELRMAHGTLFQCFASAKIRAFSIRSKLLGQNLNERDEDWTTRQRET